MNLNDYIYVGIDPTSGNKDFNYAVLNHNLSLVLLSDADLDEIVAFLAQQESAIVAVNAPAGVNHGLVRKKLVEEHSGPGRSVRGADIRLAEFDLRERGIVVAGTPARVEYCPAWMQIGFALYDQLSKLGYKPYGADHSGCQVLETHPFACYCALAESISLPKSSLEGRLQRQLILNDKGMRIRDAMDFFEEITRFKLMKGVLPKDILYSPEQLDVMVAAYTAWLAAHNPGEVTRVGDKDEGQIILPVKELKAKY